MAIPIAENKSIDVNGEVMRFPSQVKQLAKIEQVPVLNFDGTSFVSLANIVTVNVGSKATITMYIRGTEASNVNAYLVGEKGPDATSLNAYINQFGQLFAEGYTQNQQISSTVNVWGGGLHLLELVWEVVDANLQTFTGFIDGVQQYYGEQTPALAPIRFSAFGQGTTLNTSFFRGTMWDIRLSIDGVETSFWPCNDTTGFVLFDLLGDNEGAISGSDPGNFWGREDNAVDYRVVLGRPLLGDITYSVPNDVDWVSPNGVDWADIGEDTFSMCAWFNTGAVPGTERFAVLGFGSSQNNEFVTIMTPAASDVLSIEFGGVATALVGTTPIQANVWNHIGMIYDSETGRFRLYLNLEIEIDTVTTPGLLDPINNNTKFYIGNQEEDTLFGIKGSVYRPSLFVNDIGEAGIIAHYFLRLVAEDLIRNASVSTSANAGIVLIESPAQTGNSSIHYQEVDSTIDFNPFQAMSENLPSDYQFGQLRDRVFKEVVPGHEEDFIVYDEEFEDKSYGAFDGTSYINFGSVSEVNDITTGDIFCGCVFRWTGPVAGGLTFEVLICKGGLSALENGFALYYNDSTDRWQFQVNNQGTTVVVSGPAGVVLDDGNWHRVIGWRTETNLVIEIDGIRYVSPEDASAIDISGDYPMLYGNRSALDAPLPAGTNMAWAAVADEFSVGGLKISNWFGEEGGDLLYDVSGFGNHGTWIDAVDPSQWEIGIAAHIQVQRNLTRGYTEGTFVRGTNSEYIDLGLVQQLITGDDDFEFKFDFIPGASSQYIIDGGNVGAVDIGIQIINNSPTTFSININDGTTKNSFSVTGRVDGPNEIVFGGRNRDSGGGTAEYYAIVNKGSEQISLFTDYIDFAAGVQPLRIGAAPAGVNVGNDVIFFDITLKVQGDFVFAANAKGNWRDLIGDLLPTFNGGDNVKIPQNAYPGYPITNEEIVETLGSALDRIYRRTNMILKIVNLGDISGLPGGGDIVDALLVEDANTPLEIETNDTYLKAIDVAP